MALKRNGKNARRNYCNSAVEISRANTHSDEREHVEAPINNRLPCAREKEAARPQDHRCCQGKLDPFSDLLWND